MIYLLNTFLIVLPWMFRKRLDLCLLGLIYDLFTKYISYSFILNVWKKIRSDWITTHEILSVVTTKYFINYNNLSWWKTLRKLLINKNLKLMKSIHENLITSIIFYDEWLKDFPLRSEIGSGYLVLLQKF